MGVGIKATKKTNFKKTNNKKNIFDSIPAELIIDIVARVAASSSRDLFKAKLSCETLHKFADDKYIIQRASLDKFPVVPWTLNDHKQAIFSDRCADSENPEALCRRGIVRYFEKMEMNSGIECLLKAAKSGHLEAMYVLGLIMILHGEETKEQGMKIIIDMKNLQTKRKNIQKIRESFSTTLGSIWVKNTMVVGQAMPTCCTRQDHAKSIGLNKLADLECAACSCDQEIVHLWEILPKSI
ncbi:putative F-box protein At1g67623 [Apium graveolens]|uniref:putative F-box protein At1g67623 n=1 Tax=Apium graveolens TaxID=4045 RepID=UPI003D7BB394